MEERESAHLLELEELRSVLDQDGDADEARKVCRIARLTRAILYQDLTSVTIFQA